jgi:hypothetical protein
LCRFLLPQIGYIALRCERLAFSLISVYHNILLKVVVQATNVLLPFPASKVCRNEWIFVLSLTRREHILSWFECLLLLAVASLNILTFCLKCKEKDYMFFFLSSGLQNIFIGKPMPLSSCPKGTRGQQMFVLSLASHINKCRERLAFP